MKSAHPWLQEFEHAQGRPLRVLHVGNIANNGYLNAKILNAHGVECDLLCYDYYHIMGTPEWEEADFEFIGLDQNNPPWSRINLGQFKRPAWIGQGHLFWSQAYLHARRKKSKLNTWILWNMLTTNYMHWPTVDMAVKVLRTIIQKPWAAFLSGLFSGLVVGRKPILGAFVAPILCGPIWIKLISARLHRHWETRITCDLSRFQHRARELVDMFSKFFPYRTDHLLSCDLDSYHRSSVLFHDLFEHYDLIMTYGLEPIWPMITNNKPYLAYEHGTIRSIPFEEDSRGRLTALSYRLADQCFITNADNINAARKLGLSNCCFIPHPINEDVLNVSGVDDIRQELTRDLDSDFIVFHPPRQHWGQTGIPDWEKGNDILIRGLARFIREVNPRASAVFVEWGQKVAESKALLAQEGINHRVLWIPPQPNVRMIRYIKACDVLADQFFLGAFGSTLPKALLHGRPGMVYLDVESHRWCFQEMPPVINARTDDEVYEGLRRLYLEPEFKEDIIRRGRAWYDRYHSNEVIAGTLLDNFRIILDKHRTHCRQKGEI